MNKYNKFNNSDSKTTVRMNNSIRCPNIKIVGTNEIISNESAQLLAKNQGLDLVEVNFIKDKSGVYVSICKLINYNKYIYDKKKAEKVAAKKARLNKVEIKNIQFHITSDKADVLRKCKNIVEFLNDGNKVKVEIFLRGREQQLHEMIVDMMNTVLTNVGNIGYVEVGPKYEGRTYMCMLSKNKKINQ